MPSCRFWLGFLSPSLAGAIDVVGAIIYPFPVTGTKSSATDEAGSTPTTEGVPSSAEVKESARGFLNLSRRALSEEELSTPAARRFLIFEIERLDRQ